MKPYRPEEWEKLRDKLIKENCECIRCAIPLCQPLAEATADAMLESLEPLIRRIAPSSLLIDILYSKEKE